MIEALRAFFAGLPPRAGLGEHWLVACSGGADSTALAYALREAMGGSPGRWTLAHVHHGLRGDDADRAQEAVHRQAGELGWAFLHRRVEVAGAMTPGRSLEMTARDLRWQALEAMAREVGARGILTAHTRDDQAETLLLRLARGTGLEGAAGMAPLRLHHGLDRGKPLLDVPRTEVEEFLRQRGVSWLEDASNQDRSIPRNFIRHDILPRLREGLNPRVDQALARTASLLRDDAQSLTHLADPLCERHEGTDAILGTPWLGSGAWTGQPPGLRRTVLRRWLDRQGIPLNQLSAHVLMEIDRLLVQGRSGGPIPLTAAASLEIQSQRIWLRRADALYPPLLEETIPLRMGWTRAAGGAWAWFCARDRQRTPLGRHIGVFPASASLVLRPGFDAESLAIRTWRPGDRFQPLGGRRKKLKDIWIDHRVPRVWRSRVPLLTFGDDILWIPGYAIAEGWAVPPRTAETLYVECRPLVPPPRSMDRIKRG